MSDESQPVPEPELLRGTVKWYNDAKGFGFIKDANGKDVFVHHSVIEGRGFKTLQDGEIVGYIYRDGPKGMVATKVVRRPDLKI